MRQVDFRQLGIFFPDKDYSSVQEAHHTLLQGKARMSHFLTAAKSKQIENFRNAVGNVVKEDTLITSMPNIRINTNKSALPHS